MTINLVDRFLSCKVVSEAKLQLVGVAALLIACKYEETQPIGETVLSDLLEMAEGAFSREQIIQAERYVLRSLGHNISNPGPIPFLRKFSETESNNMRSRKISEYFLECTLLDERFVGVPPSLVAAAAMYSSKTVLNESWVCHFYSLVLHSQIGGSGGGNFIFCYLATE